MKVHNKNSISPSPNLLTTICIIVFTITQILSWIPCYVYRRLLIIYVALFRKDFGKILDHMSTLLFDDFCNNPSNCSIVSVLELDNHVTIQNVRDIFRRNVLQARIPTGKRYSQLEQYQVDFMGYRFWREDPNFKIENHIREDIKWTSRDQLPSLEQVHQQMLNQTYPENQSPWQVILLKCGTVSAENCLLVFRMHHSMGDGKSIVKLLVECLGQKDLKTATARQGPKKRFWDHLLFFILLPYNLVRVNVLLYAYELQTLGHPWRVQNYNADYSPFVFGMSQKVPLWKIKKVAVQHKVQPSAVLMSIITGAIQKFTGGCGGTSWTGNLPVYCTLPKEEHPQTLKNHLLIGLPVIPTDADCSLQCLQQCQKQYLHLRTSEVPRQMDIMAFLLSAWPSLTIRSLLAPLRCVPTGFTNVAGEEEGFSVGGVPCKDFSMSVAYPQSAIGVGFSIFSYKGCIQIGVAAKASVFSESQVRKLTDMVYTQFLDLTSFL